MGDKVGDVSLVDTPSLARDSRKWSQPEQNMLAYKIGSENYSAKQYVNYLLHGIVCCEDAGELEQYPRSVIKRSLAAPKFIGCNGCGVRYFTLVLMRENSV